MKRLTDSEETDAPVADTLYPSFHTATETEKSVTSTVSKYSEEEDAQVVDTPETSIHTATETEKSMTSTFSKCSEEEDAPVVDKPETSVHTATEREKSVTSTFSKCNEEVDAPVDDTPEESVHTSTETEKSVTSTFSKCNEEVDAPVVDTPEKLVYVATETEKSMTSTFSKCNEEEDAPVVDTPETSVHVATETKQSMTSTFSKCCEEEDSPVEDTPETSVHTATETEKSMTSTFSKCSDEDGAPIIGTPEITESAILESIMTARVKSKTLTNVKICQAAVTLNPTNSTDHAVHDQSNLDLNGATLSDATETIGLEVMTSALSNVTKASECADSSTDVSVEEVQQSTVKEINNTPVKSEHIYTSENEDLSAVEIKGSNALEDPGQAVVYVTTSPVTRTINEASQVANSNAKGINLFSAAEDREPEVPNVSGFSSQEQTSQAYSQPMISAFIQQDISRLTKFTPSELVWSSYPEIAKPAELNIQALDCINRSAVSKYKEQAQDFTKVTPQEPSQHAFSKSGNSAFTEQVAEFTKSTASSLVWPTVSETNRSNLLEAIEQAVTWMPTSSLSDNPQNRFQNNTETTYQVYSFPNNSVSVIPNVRTPALTNFNKSSESELNVLATQNASKLTKSESNEGQFLEVTESCAQGINSSTATEDREPDVLKVVCVSNKELTKQAYSQPIIPTFVEQDISGFTGSTSSEVVWYPNEEIKKTEDLSMQALDGVNRSAVTEYREQAVDFTKATSQDPSHQAFSKSIIQTFTVQVGELTKSTASALDWSVVSEVSTSTEINMPAVQKVNKSASRDSDPLHEIVDKVCVVHTNFSSLQRIP